MDQEKLTCWSCQHAGWSKGPVPLFCVHGYRPVVTADECRDFTYEPGTDEEEHEQAR